MPSGWKDSSVGAAPKVPGRTAKAAPKPSSPDLALELSRMRPTLATGDGGGGGAAGGWRRAPRAGGAAYEES